MIGEKHCTSESPVNAIRGENIAVIGVPTARDEKDGRFSRGGEAGRQIDKALIVPEELVDTEVDPGEVGCLVRVDLGGYPDKFRFAVH